MRCIIATSSSEQHPNPVLSQDLSVTMKRDVKMILSPNCLCPAAKLLVVQWRSQTIDRSESVKKRTDENVLECFRQSSCSRFGDYIA